MSLIQNKKIGEIRVDFVEPSKVNYNFCLLFIHGMGGGSWVFKAWLEICARLGIRAYALNLNTTDGTSFNEYVKQTISVIKSIGPVVLVGHSLGGLVAQKVASLEKMVRGLVLVASVAPFGIINIPLFWFRWRYIKAILTGNQFTLDDRDARYYVLNEVADPGVIQKQVRPESGRVLRDAAMGVWVGELKIPILVLSGSKDRILPDKMQWKIARHHDAEIWNYDNGHMIPNEVGHERIMGDIIGWCRRNARYMSADWVD